MHRRTAAPSFLGLLPLCTAALSVPAHLSFTSHSMFASRHLKTDGSGDVAECTRTEFERCTASIADMCISCIRGGFCPAGCCISFLSAENGADVNQLYLYGADKSKFKVVLNVRMAIWKVALSKCSVPGQICLEEVGNYRSICCVCRQNAGFVDLAFLARATLSAFVQFI
jgi:hypothetical protein